MTVIRGNRKNEEIDRGNRKKPFLSPLEVFFTRIYEKIGDLFSAFQVILNWEWLMLVCLFASLIFRNTFHFYKKCVYLILKYLIRRSKRNVNVFIASFSACIYFLFIYYYVPRSDGVIDNEVVVIPLIFKQTKWNQRWFNALLLISLKIIGGGLGFVIEAWVILLLEYVESYISYIFTCVGECIVKNPLIFVLCVMPDLSVD